MVVEDNSHWPTLPGREYQKTTDELMIRRMKNRDRQRRYRARKRLEAEMNKSHSIEQQAVLKTESQLRGTSINVGACGNPLQAAIQSDAASPRFDARVYCGRKWKKDARQVNASKEPGIPASPTLKPPVEVEPILDHPLAARRDWKADARNKIDLRPHENGPNE